MGIPEHRLENWSNPGAQTGSAETYNSIKAALSSHEWPHHMRNYTVYLQGSYPNHTNIRGDSDVDVVVETPSTFYHNVSHEQRELYGLTTPGSFTWHDFRDEVKSALRNYYGSHAVTQGNKSIKVAGYGNRLNADVIPCNEYRRYTSYYIFASGMTFWSLSGKQIINYPNLHLANGSAKNMSCNHNYKPSIRMLKNARNHAKNEFPSYFLECLIYNVTDHCFQSSHSQTFLSVLLFLCRARDNGQLPSFLCQNQQQRMFGSEEHQISIDEGLSFIDTLVRQWNHW